VSVKRSRQRLPETLEGSTLAGMLPGETAYTMPWAMWCDSDRLCWLHPDYPARSTPGGTVQMRLRRAEDGFEVWPPADATYQPRAHHGFVSPNDTPWLPVVAIAPR
jgi:hypothetical protein